jgi:hypothetical protein
MPLTDPEKRKAYMREYHQRTDHAGKERQRYRDYAPYREQQREYRKANLAKYAEYQRNQRAKNPRGALVAQAKYRAKRDGLPFDISVETLQWPTHCPILGIELDYSRTPPGERKIRTNAATLDRKVCELGLRAGECVRDLTPGKPAQVGRDPCRS